MSNAKEDGELVRRIAAASMADIRTVWKALRGERVVGKVGDRIRVAIRALASKDNNVRDR